MVLSSFPSWLRSFQQKLAFYFLLDCCLNPSYVVTNDDTPVDNGVQWWCVIVWGNETWYSLFSISIQRAWGRSFENAHVESYFPLSCANTYWLNVKSETGEMQFTWKSCRQKLPRSLNIYPIFILLIGLGFGELKAGSVSWNVFFSFPIEILWCVYWHHCCWLVGWSTRLWTWMGVAANPITRFPRLLLRSMCCWCTLMQCLHGQVWLVILIKMEQYI